ncbi:sugar ABC transporter ATP-binding protein [Herbiconiux ginsengi]|uniref:Putative multiple sugar transport system ATP-binding protein n=1 Tax=Herbiconiux ginsengi TaxID=381665 RepID=A0A1H3TMC9_9MICO|nr:sugar ABC transporter ATP-binding protein [Herbiconiux ginsengi]SDZ50971.1 putative multiple sugar transport system ATP-binding protein [Herbiconiux ginsengi]
MSTETDDGVLFALASGDAVGAAVGELVALCGENGSGLDVVLRETTDRILARGPGSTEAAARVPATALIGRRRGLTPGFDVAENVFLGNERKKRLGPIPLGIDWERTRADTAEILRGLGSSLTPRMRARGLGEYDRLIVELARAIARSATSVVLDEPAERLGEADAGRFFRLLRSVAERGIAVLVLTQKPRQALGYADRLVVVRDSAVVAEHPRSEWSDGVAAAERVRAHVLTELVDRGPRPGPERESGSAADIAARPELLRITGWSTHDPLDPESLLVDGADLVVRSGEIVGIAGLRRSGAQALLLSVYGNSAGTKPTGTVSVRGSQVKADTVERAIAAGLYFASTDAPQYRVRFVGGIAVPVSSSKLPGLVKAGLVDRDSDLGPGDGWGGRLLGAVRSLSREGSQSDHIRGLVKEFAASERLVLLLGDPTAGATPAERAEVHAGLARIARSGKAVVIASDDLDELLAVCDRVIGMAAGRVTGEVPGGSAPATLAALIVRD